jgi:hypothetical protein
MELVVRKTDLLRELQLFQGIVERKNTIPILANVLLEANGTEVKMLATDLEVGLRSKCPATVSKGGSLTLPAKKLYEIIKALPETDVRIEEDKGGVKVAADRFDSRMQTLPREDFPTLPDAGGALTAELPREALRQYWDHRIEFAPPQIMSLVHLARHASVASVMEAARARTPPCIRPQPQDVDGVRVLCYPGDPWHADREQVLSGPTRLCWRNKRFEPEGGLAMLLGE